MVIAIGSCVTYVPLEVCHGDSAPSGIGSRASPMELEEEASLKGHSQGDSPDVIRVGPGGSALLEGMWRGETQRGHAVSILPALALASLVKLQEVKVL